MNKVNIIYLLPELKGVSGGAKSNLRAFLYLKHFRSKYFSSIVHLKKRFLTR